MSSPARVAAGTTTPTTGSSGGSARTRSSAAASSSATLWTRPLATATAGPPRSSLVIVSPSDSNTTGGPAVKIDAVPAHHREVRHRRDQRAVAGRRAEHRGDQRHAARAARLGEHVGRASARRARPSARKPAPSSIMISGTRSVDRDLGDPVALRVRRLADRAGLHREVLGRDHHRAAVDAARAHHDRVGRRVLAADERARAPGTNPGRAGGRCAPGRRACRAARCFASRSSPPIARAATRRSLRSSRVAVQSASGVASPIAFPSCSVLTPPRRAGTASAGRCSPCAARTSSVRPPVRGRRRGDPAS